MNYTVTRLSEHITHIYDPTEVSSYLVEGNDSAVLIDTGIGIRGLKETVDSLTNKPYVVLLTHGHGDHAGGCSQFSQVYLAPVDLPMLYGHGMEMRTGYCLGAFKMKEEVIGEHTDFDPARDLVPPPTEDQDIKALEDGMIFDLGGISIETIAVPGHTKGSCMFLIPEERTILFGDACNSNTLVAGGESTSISEYQASLIRLNSMADRFDTVLYSHGPAIGPKYCLEDNLILCEKILSGTDAHIPMPGIFGMGYLAAERKDPINRADGRFGNIFYSDLTLGTK